MYRLLAKESKLALGLVTDARTLRTLNLPPNTWVPSRAKMPRNRKSKTSRETMASIELMREASRFCKDFQYLQRTREGPRLARVDCQKIVK